jgi:hypothetical protein
LVFNFRGLSERYGIRWGFFRLAGMAAGALSFAPDFTAPFMGSVFPTMFGRKENVERLLEMIQKLGFSMEIVLLTRAKHAPRE